MKQRATTSKNIILTVLLFPILLLFLIGFLIATPFDWLKYKRTRYYKDTREKYTWLCMLSAYVRLYDLIKNENLPIEYHRCDRVPIAAYGYFVYGDTLIINDLEPCFDNEKGVWIVENEDEYVDLTEDVAATIAQCNEFLKSDVCRRAVVLTDSRILKEHPAAEYENFRLLPVVGDNELAALREIVE